MTRGLGTGFGEVVHFDDNMVQDASGNLWPQDAFIEALQNISQADTGEVTKIASEEIKIIREYHLEVLKQSKQSFNWAKYVAIIGFIFFIGAVIFLLVFQLQSMATISLIAAALIEVSSGVGFYLYSKSISQMADYFHILDATQRYLLANSICEGLDGDYKQKARSDLIRTISNEPLQLESNKVNETPHRKNHDIGEQWRQDGAKQTESSHRDEICAPKSYPR
ncbi:MAG: hypothetical protein ABR985_15445 [Methanotrichaceae archaeon]|jgi:hypothetical protein